MTGRKFDDLPRLSGRPDGTATPAGAEPSPIFRRFFHLLERADRPAAPPSRPAMPRAPLPHQKKR